MINHGTEEGPYVFPSMFIRQINDSSITYKHSLREGCVSSSLYAFRDALSSRLAQALIKTCHRGTWLPASRDVSRTFRGQSLNVGASRQVAHIKTVLLNVIDKMCWTWKLDLKIQSVINNKHKKHWSYMKIQSKKRKYSLCCFYR